MEKVISGVNVTSNEELSDKEISLYLEHVRNNNPNRGIEFLNLVFEGEDVNLSYKLAPVNFEKIRRITGYLVGTVDRFNNGKAAEERDRVKHSI